MSLENGTPRAEEVDRTMDVRSRGVWRRVIVDAKVTEGRRGRRARFTVLDATGKPIEIDMSAHATIRARPAELPDCVQGQDGQPAVENGPPG